MNVSIMTYLDRTKVPVSIDIGFGDIVYPDRVKMEFPVLFDMEIPRIYAYSISSVISEKFEAIVSLGDSNSRYKDFYDIYILADRYDLEGAELKDVVKLLKTLLLPIIESITENNDYSAKWNHESRSWK